MHLYLRYYYRLTTSCTYKRLLYNKNIHQKVLKYALKYGIKSPKYGENCLFELF